MGIAIRRIRVHACFVIGSLGVAQRLAETERSATALMRPACVLAAPDVIGRLIEERLAFMAGAAFQMGGHHVAGHGDRLEKIETHALVWQR